VVTLREFENKAMYPLLNSQNVADAFTELEFLEE